MTALARHMISLMWLEEMETHGDDGDDSVRTQVMPAGTAPPPSSTDRSCVYVVKRPDGMFYCGQSDRLAGE